VGSQVLVLRVKERVIPQVKLSLLQVNSGGTGATGNLTLERIDFIRWIDNYGRIEAHTTRFGGEFAGIPIVAQIGAPGSDPNYASNGY